MSTSVGHLVQDLTEGRPFVFVIMSYNQGWSLYEQVQSIVEHQTDLKCLRADDVLASGHDLLEKIHLLIDRAELVIAEISTRSENVYYEVGYALGRNKPLLLLANFQREIPTDLKGRELIKYSDSKDGAQRFEKELKSHLSSRLGSRFALLRDMLLADNPAPSYIVASPRYPTDRSKIPGQRYDRRTFGDNLGIRGLIESFGTILGEASGVELISAQYPDVSLLSENLNLYLIGSKKVNPPAETILDKIERSFGNRHWYFGHMRKAERGNQYVWETREDEEQGDYICRLYENDGNAWQKLEGTLADAPHIDGLVHKTDYGLIVRAPHPQLPQSQGRIVLLLAGAHSLGSGAACLAATRSSKIREIRDALPAGRQLEDKTQAFWALVKGTLNDRDGMLDETAVEIVRAGWYE